MAFRNRDNRSWNIEREKISAIASQRVEDYCRTADMMVASGFVVLMILLVLV